VNRNTHQNVSCHIFYKTIPILIKFGTWFPDSICHTVMSKSKSKIKVSK